MTLRAISIIQKFGGTRDLARKIGKAASTVQSWKEVGRIRDIYEEEILAAAAASGITIEPSDYVQPKAQFSAGNGVEMSHAPESDSAVSTPHQENGTEIPPAQEETQNRDGDGTTENRGGGGQPERRRRFPGEAGVL